MRKRKRAAARSGGALLPAPKEVNDLWLDVGAACCAHEQIGKAPVVSQNQHRSVLAVVVKDPPYGQESRALALT